MRHYDRVLAINGEHNGSEWSNSIYDRGCARAIPDHVMKVTDRESAKIFKLNTIGNHGDRLFFRYVRIPPI